MRCPFCSQAESRVLESRTSEDGQAIRRRRECQNCAKRFTTYEKIEEMPLLVVKKDGRRELFDRGKVIAGIVKACEKRPVSASQMEQVVDDIEKRLRNQMTQECSTTTIGEAIMDALKELDQVAYVRFASVYREFTDVKSFLEELESLIKHKGR